MNPTTAYAAPAPASWNMPPDAALDAAVAVPPPPPTTYDTPTPAPFSAPTDLPSLTPSPTPPPLPVPPLHFTALSMRELRYVHRASGISAMAALQTIDSDERALVALSAMAVCSYRKAGHLSVTLNDTLDISLEDLMAAFNVQPHAEAPGESPTA